MYSAKGLQASPWRGCPIRTSPDQSLLAAPRGLSQPSTSFIGSWCQGIHRAPLLARRLDLSNPPSRQDQCSYKTLLSVQFCTSLGLEVPNVCICLLNYSSILQVRFRPERAQKRARHPSSHSGHGKSSATYAVGDSSLRMIRLSSGPREHTRQATASARAPRTSTISRRLRSVQVTLFLAAPRGVEPRGFEPLTSAVQRRRSPN